MGFVFYDTETTGTDAAFDQILQFAAIHTDPEFNELERFEIRCRLLPHVVPSPSAMRVTKVTPESLFDLSLCSHYEMTCRVRSKLLSWSPALFIGYNSIEFDEHLLRQAFYKNLHHPYLTNSNGNSRSDAMRMVQAASLFAPDAIAFPADEYGQRIYKLDRVAPLNGFAHDHAHDALADVEATIFLCRLIMERAPDLWSTFMRFGQKAAVADYISAESVFSLSDFYFGNPYSWLVTTIGSNPENNAEYFVYNLAVDPESLVELSDEDLVDRVGVSPKPVRRLRINACPIIRPAEDAPAIATAADLGPEELARRAEFLNNREQFRHRLIKAFQATREEAPPSLHLERQLYDGFFPREDEPLMERFHLVPWEERPSIVEGLKDRRLRKIGQRLIYLERPDLLSETARLQYDRAIATRITTDKGETPWLTLPQAIATIDDLLPEADTNDAALFQRHRLHLTDRMERAIRAIGEPPIVIAVTDSSPATA